MLKYISLAIIVAFALCLTGQFANTKERSSSDYVGFDDPGMEVSGSAHLFVTPSENISCLFWDHRKTRLLCERHQPDYVAIFIEATGNPVREAPSGEVGGGPWMSDPVLPYSTWWSNGSIACLSEERGLTCKNKDGHGFLLSRTQVRTF
jgi:hypothetical protein